MSQIVYDGRITIETGEDKRIRILLWNVKERLNFDLSNYTYFELQFKKDDNSLLIKNSLEQPAIAASASIGGVDFLADNTGVGGNGIELVFDGVLTVEQVKDAWNAANPLNTITTSGLDGSNVLPAQSVVLAGGVNATTYVERGSVPQLGLVYCQLTNDDSTSMAKGKGLAYRLILDEGPHPTGNRISKTFYNLDVKPSSL